MNNRHLLISGLYRPDWANVKPDYFEPFTDKWTMNDYFEIPAQANETWDMVWQIHKGFVGVHESIPYIWKTETNVSNWIDFYNTLKKTTIITTSKYPRLERGILFPIKEALEDVGVPFFTSTLSMMVWYAVWKGFKHITLNGFNMLHQSEYERQVPGAVRAIEWAVSKNCKINCKMYSIWKEKIENDTTAFAYDMSHYKEFIPYWLMYAQEMKIQVVRLPCEKITLNIDDIQK